jgi:hypothetical protein
MDESRAAIRAYAAGSRKEMRKLVLWLEEDLRIWETMKESSGVGCRTGCAYM